MSDIDELHQLMSGPHEARDEALLDVLNTLADSPATHTPHPTPALAAFLRHPSPAHTTIAAQHQRTWTARLLRPPSAGRRFVPAVLAGGLMPLLLGTATAVAATAATVALITHIPHPSPPAAPAPTAPSASTRPSPNRAAPPAHSTPTDPDATSASATSTPRATGVPTPEPKTDAGGSLVRIAPSGTTTGRSEHEKKHPRGPAGHNGDHHTGADRANDDAKEGAKHHDRGTKAPQTAGPHDHNSKTRKHQDADREDHGKGSTKSPDRADD